VEKFGIEITVVEPGFFRTDLLDAHNIRWVSKVIEDYAPQLTYMLVFDNMASRQSVGDVQSRS
jgi:hypothetical protein